MAVWKSDLENPTSRSGLRSKVKAQGWLSNHSMTFLFYVNRPAITTIWPIRCSTHCHQYGRQTFSTHIYIYIYHVRSQGNKVFFWNVGKCFPHAGGVVVELDWKQEIPLVSWGDFDNLFYCLNTENLTWMIHVPNDLSQYWNCSISFYIRHRLALKTVALCYIFVLNLSIYLE